MEKGPAPSFGAGLFSAFLGALSLGAGKLDGLFPGDMLHRHLDEAGVLEFFAAGEAVAHHAGAVLPGEERDGLPLLRSILQQPGLPKADDAAEIGGIFLWHHGILPDDAEGDFGLPADGL